MFIYPEKFSSEPDIIVVGSGLSGLYAAYLLAKSAPERQILIITKDSVGESNTKYAQGGLAAPLYKPDDWSSHYQDTIKAGGGLCDLSAVKLLVQEANDAVNDLVNIGVNFDKDEKGNIAVTMEGGHSHRRIVHAQGDATGKEIVERLQELVRNALNIKVIDYHLVVNILKNNQRVNGVVVYDKKTKKLTQIWTKAIILATGGYSALYSNTSNPPSAIGDAIYLAYNIGAILSNMEFEQFHPTVFYHENLDERFLITEAVRGEGGYLINKKGERFMSKYHPNMELAPRDVVSSAILAELQASNEDFVYLDIRHIPKETVEKRFPSLIERLKKHNINLPEDLIPVSPAAHYSIGGIKINSWGGTNISGLWAIGESSCSGVHGANRLASNSLLECAVYANRSTTSILGYLHEDNDYAHNNPPYYLTAPDNGDFYDILNKQYSDTVGELHTVMWENVGPVRDRAHLEQALSYVEDARKKLIPVPAEDYFNLVASLGVAEIIIRSAIARKESRGGHYRTDYPATDEKGISSFIVIDKQEVYFA